MESFTRKSMIVVSLLFITLLFVNARNNKNQKGYGVGDLVTEEIASIKMTSVDEKAYALQDLSKNQGIILIFTCNTCPYAKMYEDRIIALHHKYADKGFPVVAVNPNDADIQPGDSFYKMQERAKEKQYPFLYLQDKTQEVAKAFGAEKTPHVYLLKRDKAAMKIAYIGTIDNNPQSAAEANKFYLEEAVDAVLSGKEVSKTITKAIGCSIKWKES